MGKRTPAEKSLVFLVFLVILLNLTGTLYLLHQVEQRVGGVTANVAEGTVRLCLNQPPVIDIPCDPILGQGTSYTCQLNASDPDGDNITYTEQYVTMQILNITSTGLINITPSNAMVGEHATIIIVDDDSGCANGRVNTTWYFNVSDLNDAPYLSVPIPDVQLLANQTYSFFLSDHFIDPDGDPLNYTRTAVLPALEVTIQPNSNVIIRSSECDIDVSVIYTATDPDGLSADSNIQNIRITCPEPPAPGDGSEETLAGGGGGGGGALFSCKSEWQCMDWMQCLPTGYQWRHCYDLEGCEDPRFFKRECQYEGQPPECEENWLCDPWGLCLPNGTQYRGCQDLNACGSIFFQPPLEQRCIYYPTCSDGIQNGDETGVDCGGPCPPCPIIETPAFIEETRFEYWLLIALILAVVLIGGVGRLYHEEIAHAMARLTFLLSHRKRKQFLLTQAQKHELLEKIGAVEHAVAEHPEWEPAKKYLLATAVGRRVFEIALGLPAEFTVEELAPAFKEKKVNKELVAVLHTLFERIYGIEGTNLAFDQGYFLSITEELRSVVLAISKYEVSEIERPLTQFTITNEISFLQEAFIRMVRTYRALQFEQYELAEAEYQKLLKVYEFLPKQDQEHMYDELQRLFHELKYVLERREEVQA